MKVSGIHSGYFASDQKWIGYTTLAHLVAERCLTVEIATILPNIENGADFYD